MIDVGKLFGYLSAMFLILYLLCSINYVESYNSFNRNLEEVFSGVEGRMQSSYGQVKYHHYNRKRYKYVDKKIYPRHYGRSFRGG